MNEEKFLDLAISIELNLSELYYFFYEIFPEDKDFWWKIASEEVNHASLLKSTLVYSNIGMFPEEILMKNISEYEELNDKILFLFNKYKREHPDRKEAFEIAIDIENSSYEKHFQEVMTGKSNSKVIEILQELNKSDKDHLERLKSYYLK